VSFPVRAASFDPLTSLLALLDPHEAIAFRCGHQRVPPVATTISIAELNTMDEAIRQELHRARERHFVLAPDVSSSALDHDVDVLAERVDVGEELRQLLAIKNGHLERRQ